MLNNVEPVGVGFVVAAVLGATGDLSALQEKSLVVLCLAFIAKISMRLRLLAPNRFKICKKKFRMRICLNKN
jgi:hypothetical protein